ncbi:hypothetical protein KC19_2G157600 [Ceratodon purpureus]|uniref:alpha-1,2-Mannosidase n=1 Tax=Ceratodon purpureus TaxID=3225 RepID=A0A8T0IWM6_CERPU|nr:hypothetical protein KC19_2G157600 [Ceratodon purpureus]
MWKQGEEEGDAAKRRGGGWWSRCIAADVGAAAAGSTPCWGRVSAVVMVRMVENRRGLSLAASGLVVMVLLLGVSVGVPSMLVAPAIAPAVAAPVTALEAADLRDEVKNMFYHGFDNYMRYAFPLDELKPMSCTGEDSLGGYSLTLVDSLDMLALLGDRTQFSKGVSWLGKNLSFDRNKTVSVFETTIRVLGGLLSAHLIASDPLTGMQVDPYNNELLDLATDLGRRMLPAFDTPTGIPFGSVNLALGVSDDESQVSSTAGGGTLSLEFSVLSRLTGDPEFEKVAKRAVQGLWAYRSRLGLVGGHINVFTSEWTHKDAGIGTSIDSFYEYLLKAYLLLGDEEYLHIFKEAYKSVMRHLYSDPWYLEVNMNSGVVVWPLFNSLQAFWPGLQVLAGDVEPAIRTHKAFFAVWKRYGFTPEGFNLATSSVQPGQRSYPLRPELVESTYMLYKATRNPVYLSVGRDIVTSLQKSAKCRCGYCHIADVESHEQDDHMESFFLSETVKYLWLLFDLAAGGDNLVEKGPHPYIFNTEGHFLPMSPEISLPAENCSSADSICKERIAERLPYAKRKLKKELEDSSRRNQANQCSLNDLDSQTCSDNEEGGIRDNEWTVSAESHLKGMCPALNHWRQLVYPELQSRALSRAKSVSVDPTCRVAAQDDMLLSKMDEENLIRIAVSTENSMRKRFAEKQFKDSSAGSIDGEGDDGRTSLQVTSDDTGELNFKGKESLIHLISTLMNWKKNSFEVNWKENSIKVGKKEMPNWRETDVLDSVDVEGDIQTPGR